MGYFPFGSSNPSTPWLPSDNNLLGSTQDLADIVSSSLALAGSQYLVKYTPRNPHTITNLSMAMLISGAGASSGSFMGVINQSGLLVAQTADIGAALAGATGTITAPITPAVPVNTWVWLVFLSNLVTTQPTMGDGGSSPWLAQNLGLTPATAQIAVNGTGLTALQSITPANNNITGAQAPRRWFFGIT